MQFGDEPRYVMCLDCIERGIADSGEASELACVSSDRVYRISPLGSQVLKIALYVFLHRVVLSQQVSHDFREYVTDMV